MTLKQSKEMAKKACQALEDKKAKDVRTGRLFSHCKWFQSESGAGHGG